MGKAKRKPAAKAKNDAGGGREGKVLATNRQARYDYEILEQVEAGIVLTGTEIKSARAGRINIREAYARVEKGEMWLHNMHIAQYEAGGHFNHEPTRSRKLLLHRKQIGAVRGISKSVGIDPHSSQGLPSQRCCEGAARCRPGQAPVRQAPDNRHAGRGS